MSETHIVTEQERIRALADDYRSQGYDVLVEPGAKHLPDFLSGYRPDLLVSRGEETTVVEVKSRRALSSDAQARHLARLIEGRPGWRFELVVVSDPPSGPPQGAVAFDPPRALRVLGDGRALLKDGYVGPALLVGWAALEAALRLLLQAEGVEPRRPTPSHLLKQAVEEGVLGREEYQALREAMEGRNAIAHGYENASVSSSAVGQLLDVAQRLLDEASSQESA